MGKPERLKLRLRGTFIDCQDLADGNCQVTPRAHSEPAQSVSRSSAMFECEQNYIQQLESGRHRWSTPRRMTKESEDTARTRQTQVERLESQPRVEWRDPSEEWRDPRVEWRDPRVEWRDPREEWREKPQNEAGTKSEAGLEEHQWRYQHFDSKSSEQKDISLSASLDQFDGSSPSRPSPTRTLQSSMESNLIEAVLVGSGEFDGDHREDSPCPSLHGEAGSECNERADSQSEVSTNAASVPVSQWHDREKQAEPLAEDEAVLPKMEKAMPVGLVTPSTQAPIMGSPWDASSVIDDYDTHERKRKSEARRRGWSSAASVRSEPGTFTSWQDKRNKIAEWEERHRRVSAGASSVGILSRSWKHHAPAADHNQEVSRSNEGTNSDCAFREDNLKEQYRQKIKKQSSMSCVSDAASTTRPESRDSRDGSRKPEKERAKKDGQKIHFERTEREHQELRSKMETSAQQFKDAWGSERRLSTAMAVFEEIPRRIGDDMHRMASHVVDNVQSEVEFMSKMVRQTATSDPELVANQHHHKATEKVVKNLEVIPTMVSNLLAARVEKAKATVRQRITGMINNLSAIQEEDGEDNDQLVAQMRLISAEVEQIAGDAVEAAAQECYSHKTRQLDFALAALKAPDNQDDGAEEWPQTWPQTWENMNQQFQSQTQEMSKVTEKAELWPRTVEAAGDGHMANMEQAVAVMQDKDYMPHSVTNQVVADELLRAKVRRGGANQPGWQTQRSDQTTVSFPKNPGSQGHPDFCTRPCLYYSTGNCSNGAACGFCHLPHPKRPVRLDKRHREILKKMPFEDLLVFLLPVLHSKVQEVSAAPEVGTLLDTLVEVALNRVGKSLYAECTPTSIGAGAAMSPAARMLFDSMLREDPGKRNSASATGSVHSFTSSADAESRSSTAGGRRKGGFLGALQVMGARSLLTMLNRVAPLEAAKERELIDTILTMFHEGAEPIEEHPLIVTNGPPSDGGAVRSGVRTPSEKSHSSASGMLPPGDWSYRSPTAQASAQVAGIQAQMQAQAQALMLQQQLASPSCNPEAFMPRHLIHRTHTDPMMQSTPIVEMRRTPTDDEVAIRNAVARACGSAPLHAHARQAARGSF